MAGNTLSLEERFWNKVATAGPDECWLWQATKNNKGYGLLQKKTERGNGKRLAHRISYEIHNGPVPNGLCVLHRCDNPPCVNPRHLFVGTNKDNTQDCLAKGRHRYVPSGSPPPVFYGDDHYTHRRPELVCRGEEIGTSKLNPSDVLDIWRRRIAGEAQRAIARFYSLDKSTVQAICRGERWSHLLGKDGAPTLEQLLSLPVAKPPTKLKAADIPIIRHMIAQGLTNHVIAAQYGVDHATISDIRRGVAWRRVL